MGKGALCKYRKVVLKSLAWPSGVLIDGGSSGSGSPVAGRFWNGVRWWGRARYRVSAWLWSQRAAGR